MDKIKREPDTTFAEDLDKWARRIASETNFATGGYVSKGQLQDIIGGDLHFGHLVSKEKADIMRAYAERHRCPPNSVRVVNVKVTVDDDGRASAHIVRHNRLRRIAPKVRRAVHETIEYNVIGEEAPRKMRGMRTEHHIRRRLKGP